MNNYNIDDIEQEILTILNDNLLGNVFDQIENVFIVENSSFPYLGFELTNESEVYESQCSNLVNSDIELYVFQEINKDEGISRLEAKNTVRKGTKQVKELFQSDFTLGGKCNKCLIDNIEYGTTNDDTLGVVYFSRIILNVEFSKNINIV